MTGIDFADTVVVRRTTNKGTSVISEPAKAKAWTGEEFKKAEVERLKLAGDLMIMSAKGTKRIKLSDLETTKTPDTKGYYISTGKGTGRLKI